jgi:hypothetical protein
MRPYRSEIRTDVISRWDGLWSIAISTASTGICLKKTEEEEEEEEEEKKI